MSELKAFNLFKSTRGINLQNNKKMLSDGTILNNFEYYGYFLDIGEVEYYDGVLYCSELVEPIKCNCTCKKDIYNIINKELF